MPVIEIFANRAGNIGLEVVDQSILPFVYENRARCMKRCNVDQACTNSCRSDKLPNLLGEVMQLFTFFRLHLNQRAGHAMRTISDVDGLLWSFHGGRSHCL